MYVVAITRWAATLDEELQPLSQLLGITAYDARLRLAGPTPVIFGQTRDAEEAKRWLGGLRGRGHGAVGCDLEQVPTLGSAAVARSFELTPTAFCVRGAQEAFPPLAWERIAALIHARVSSEERTITQTTTKRLALGRAVLTGGMSLKRKSRERDRTIELEHEHVLYVVRGDGHPTIVFRETETRYAGLGDRMEPTRRGNFRVLLEVLRERAPRAHYDDRLVSGKRKPLPVSVKSGKDQKSRKVTVATTTVEESNAGPTAVAAHLIAVAIAQRQL